MSNECAELKLENDRLRDCLSGLVKDIDAWEAAVATIIGRPPNATWGNLEEARELIRRS